MPTLALNDLERRTLANLSIPRTVPDLSQVLLVDQYTPYGPAVEEEEVKAGRALDGQGQDLQRLLEDLSKHEWCVNLGSYEDSSKLMAKVADGFKGSIPFEEDERARNFERRRAGDAAWRINGDVWMLTTEGLEKLREPVGAVTRLTVSQVEEVLRKHAAAVKELPVKGSIFDEDGGFIDPKIAAKESLTSGVPDPDNPGRPTATLLPEEYAHWAKLVSEDCEAAWGVKPQQPLAGGAGYFDATEDLIQAADAGGTAYGETSPTFFALTILAFTDVDTGTTADNGSHIPTYTGYARKSTTTADLGTSANGTRTNANAIIWAACTAGTSTILGAGRMVAATVGRAIRYLTVASTTISATQTPAQFAAGALTDTLD